MVFRGPGINKYIKLSKLRLFGWRLIQCLLNSTLRSQNLIAGLTLDFSCTTWKRISTWTPYLQWKSRSQKALLLPLQGIWVPKLVFVNTEKKLNTKNDDKAFAVARWNVFIQESGRFLSPGDILRTQKADTLCWITSTFLRWQTNIFGWSLSLQGSSNPITLSRVYDVPWLCEYDMRW